MMSIQRMIFPAIVMGGLVLILLTRWMGNPQVEVQAAAAEQQAPVPIMADLVAALTLASAEPSATPESAPAAELPQPVEEGQPGVVEEAAADEADAGCQVNASYPDSIRQWCDLISVHARNQGIDPNLVAAVMLQESGGNPQAYSSSGAVGLMQVMPRDGLAANFMCKNGPCFASRPSMDELYDPDFNINYGARMLANLIGKTGDVREALRAYGPMDMGYRYADIVLAIYARYE